MQEEGEEYLYTNGIIDFEKVASDIKFLEGIERVQKGLEKGYRIAFMCTEKEPLLCHRAILVARNLYKREIEVEHILFDGSLLNHRNLEILLMDKYYPNRKQINMFKLNESINYLDGHDISLRKNDRIPSPFLKHIGSSLKLIEVKQLDLFVVREGESYGNSRRKVNGILSYSDRNYITPITDERITNNHLNLKKDIYISYQWKKNYIVY